MKPATILFLALPLLLAIDVALVLQQREVGNESSRMEKLLAQRLEVEAVRTRVQTTLCSISEPEMLETCALKHCPSSREQIHERHEQFRAYCEAVKSR